MTFTPKPFDVICAEMVKSTQTRLKQGDSIDLAVGSVIRTLYDSFAYEVALLYEQMDQVYHSAFIDTASGLQLEMVVAILGIKRGLPDYAEGVVTFTRDVGQDDIEIPLGTLVTTEDSAESPRKAYTTIAAKLFPAGDTKISVNVQAMERGEEQVVAAKSITVMPMPVAGVKAVFNKDATQFLGKRLETDNELRQRAKNALLASGKASLMAIETALLSLPGVREVKVVEPGPVGVEKNYGVLDIYIDDRDLEAMPASEWSLQPSLPTPSSSPSPPSQDDNSVSSTMSLAEQKRQRERIATLRKKIDEVRAAGVYVRLHGAELVELDGMVQIAVEASADPETVTAAVKTAIENHLARLSLGKPLLFPPLVQAMLSVPGVANMEEFALIPRWPNQSPASGQPQISADTLASTQPPDHDDAPDPAQSPVSTQASTPVQPPALTQPSLPVMSNAKQINPSDQNLSASKFYLGDLRVVHQPQNIPVRVEFWVEALPSEPESTITSEAQSTHTSQVEQDVLKALKPWFPTTVKLATPLVKANLLDGIPDLVRPKLKDLQIIPQNPSSLMRQDETTLTPGFAERFVLEEPLAVYDRYLDLVGALRVTVPPQLIDAEYEKTRTNLRNRLQQFLEQWPPRQDLSLVDLQKDLQKSLAKGFEVGLNPKDFCAIMSGKEVDRLDPQTQFIRVETYERLRIGHLLISRETEPITVTIIALEITTRWLPDDIPPSLKHVVITPNINTPNEPPEVSFGPETKATDNSERKNLESSLEKVLRTAIFTFPKQPSGQDFDLVTLRQHLANAPDRSVTFRRLDFTITNLVVKAESVSVDGRSQIAQLGIPSTGIPQASPSQIIHVRSLERVSKVTFQPDADPETKTETKTITIVPLTP